MSDPSAEKAQGLFCGLVPFRKAIAPTIQPSCEVRLDDRSGS
jgi:hypothetical protein